jgi:hypothetical protein
LPGEFVGFGVQPTRNSTGTIGSSLHASKLLAGLFSDRINFTLSALFFCPGLSLPLCQCGGVACITLRPLFTPVLIGITVTGAVTPVAKTPLQQQRPAQDKRSLSSVTTPSLNLSPARTVNTGRAGALSKMTALDTHGQHS